jgi:hypothetical protein
LQLIFDLAEMLGEDVSVVARWSHNKIVAWVAHFEIKSEREKLRDAKEKGKQQASRMNRRAI